MSSGVEWAVVSSGLRSARVVKGGLGSQEEAEKWCAALEASRLRQNAEYFRETDGILADEPLQVASRELGPWQFHAVGRER